MLAAFSATKTISDVARLIGEVRERIEIVNTPEYGSFLINLFPLLRDLMKSRTREQFQDNTENRVRCCILEIFGKFPNNEVLRPFVSDIMQVSLKVLESDNEDNALVALKIVFDLHKSYRPSLEASIQPFLDIVNKIYDNMSMASKSILSNATSSLVTLVKSTESFKVLTESPIIVMLLFQFYPRVVTKSMIKTMPTMINTLQLNPVPSPILAATMNNKQKQRYREFLAAQVSFKW